MMSIGKITLVHDINGIATITMGMPDYNRTTAAFRQALTQCINQLKQLRNQVSGIILTASMSAPSTASPAFSLGDDLGETDGITTDNAVFHLEQLLDFSAALRRLETLNLPVVAAINGTAQGTGLALALACHYRIALSDPRIQLGFPEVKFGLTPSCGGSVRLTRLLGMHSALPFLINGTLLSPTAALAAGIIDAIEPTPEKMMQAARQWITQHPHSRQRWEETAWHRPGCLPGSIRLQPFIRSTMELIRKKTHAHYPAPEAVLCAVTDSVQVDMSAAIEIESRYFIQVASDSVAKNMLSHFTTIHRITTQERPAAMNGRQISCIGIMGAGKMGTRIARITSAKGIMTLLKDVTLTQAEKGRQEIARALEKHYQQGQLSQEQLARQLALIQPCDNPSDLADCDIIIEAVYENRELKAIVTAEVAPYLKPGGIIGSNTCSNLINDLSQACRDPSRFIGMHFFSPVRKLQLLELVMGSQTSPESLALARCFAYQLEQFPIVVNDARGFFISRIFRTFMNEGVAMLADGVDPAVIEKAALDTGMPFGPLAAQDETSLTLAHLLTSQAQRDLMAEEETWQSHPAHAIIEQMVTTYRRCGRACGAGFYDYPESGKKQLWPKLTGLFSQQSRSSRQLPEADLHDRLLYCQSLETLRCLEQGVLQSVRDANLGTIMGLGFPLWTGGALRYIHHIGVQRFIERTGQLRERYGERFTAPAIMWQHSRDNPLF